MSETQNQINPLSNASGTDSHSATAESFRPTSSNLTPEVTDPISNLQPQSQPHITSITQPVSAPQSMTTPQANQTQSTQFNSTIFRSTGVTPRSAQPQDYFAEQNAKRAKKQQQNTKTRKKILRIAIITLTILILISSITVGIIIWHQATSPNNINNINVEELVEQQQNELVAENGEYVFGSQLALEAQKEINAIIAEGGRAPEINDFFQTKIASATAQDEIINLTILEMQTYSQIALSENVIETSKTISIDDMTPYQVADYCGLLYTAYSTLGDTDAAEYYYNLSIEKDSND